MNLVTVTFSTDQGIQELQSYSLDLMVTEPVDHYVVIEDRKLSYDHWYEKLSPYYTKHRLHLVPSMLDEKYYENDSRIKNGWHRSAALKLLIADQIKSEKYLILDSKNFFVCKQTLAEWPVADGNGIIEEYNSRTWQEVNDFCDARQVSIPKQVYMSCTPIVFNTSVLKRLINDDILPLFFNKASWWSSEILLYSIFTQFHGTKLESHNVPNVTFWNAERSLDTDTLTDIYTWPNMRMLGLHRDVIKLGTDLSDFINFLASIGFDKQLVVRTLNEYTKDTLAK